MGNVRVFQLARDLNLASQEIIDRLHKLGVEAKTASSSVGEDAADKLKRAVRIELLTSKQHRFYGSEEDESEREQEQQALAARIAAEREERERAAAAAKAAAEARKHGRHKKAEAASKGEGEVAPALLHAPGAPRLAPRPSSVQLSLPDDDEAEPQEILEGVGAEATLDEAPSGASSALPPQVQVEEQGAAAADEVIEPAGIPPSEAPRPAARLGPLRPIAPVVAKATETPVAVEEPEPPKEAEAPLPADGSPQAEAPVEPVAPPPAAAVQAAEEPAPVRAARVLAPIAPVPPPAPAIVRPVAPIPRLVRPIAPPPKPAPSSSRPVGPHATASSPHPTASRPMAGTGMVPRSPYPSARGVGPGGRPSGPGMAARPGAPPSRMAPSSRAGAKRGADRSRTTPTVQREERPVYTGPPRKVALSEGVTVKELSERMPDAKSRDIMKSLLSRGLMVTVNQTLDANLAIEICREFGYEASIQSFEEEMEQVQIAESRPEDLAPRAPVITVMGHVDHGKTSLLDAIRETKVAAGEAGGITQHIGAYHVDVGSRQVVFLDTPGHEAFTLMRARGAKVTDIVVLVVAADDGVMPQTVEAIDHAKAAGVPMVVAVNKIDKPDAQPDRVRQQLADRGLLPEEWGGTTIYVNVSAKKRENLDTLLEMLLLVADMQEFKANAKKGAVGTVLEARLDKGRGSVATVLVQDGTLSVGDTIVAGAVIGKVRALVDDRGNRLKSAGPSTPVEILGLTSLPEPGDQLLVVTDSVKAQAIVAFRQAKNREKSMSASSRVRLEDLGRKIAEGQIRELPLVVKADVQGSIEAVTDQLMKIPQEKIKLRVIRSGAGAITEGDVLLAAASDAVVIGFNVRPERKATEIAERDGIDLRLYTVIYDAVEDIRNAMEGLLAPSTREVRLGAAEVRDTFKISKVGTIAGCYVSDGRVNRTAQVRLLRDNVVVFTGKVASLKRFKDDASEVKAGFECGIGIAGYNDLKPADVIEFFTTEQVKEKLE